jgi:hypothetical protein
MDKSTIVNDNYIDIYLFNIIKIKRIKIQKEIHSNNKKEDNEIINTIFEIVKQILKSLEKEEIVKIVSRILKTIKVDKLDMKLGLNLKDPIINAYTIAVINSILPLTFAKNTSNFNLKNIKYETFVSEKIIDLKIDSIIYVSIVKNIISIIKIILVILKGGIKNGNKTSNRISNDYINDFDRKYGRC